MSRGEAQSLLRNLRIGDGQLNEALDVHLAYYDLVMVQLRRLHALADDAGLLLAHADEAEAQRQSVTVDGRPSPVRLVEHEPTPQPVHELLFGSPDTSRESA